MTINNKAVIHKSNDLDNTDTGTITPIRAPYKIELCLKELLERGEAGLIELEALQAYGETCLHSTISTLANKYGLTFKRSKHQHTCKRKVVANFTRYALADEEQIDKAAKLSGRYRTKRCVAA